MELTKQEMKDMIRKTRVKKPNPDTTTFRHNKTHSIIIESAMLEFGVGKSEMLRHIITEWNMLRYRGDN